MEQSELRNILNNLIDSWENETIEFKQANKDFKLTDIGKYFSGLSNEANLNNTESAWLVFGVDNNKNIIGTDYRDDDKGLQKLKHEITDSLSPKVTFKQIHTLYYDEKRIILFEIPAAPRGMPISYQGHRYGRNGESLVALSDDKFDLIKNQDKYNDWTARIIPDATFDNLDDNAILKAKERFADRYKKIPLEDIKEWSKEIFLDKLQLTHNGKLTRAAILLLGKPESSWLLSPYPARITWSLETEEQAYEHFSIPFLLTTTEVYQRIRNINIRITPQGTLLPIEIQKYSEDSILEALHNCIAHQDYSESATIIVTEHIDRLIFRNYGSFFDGEPQDYFAGIKRPQKYRNNCLVKAMAELNMIDTMGYGIGRICKRQIERYFPLPDYDLTKQNQVAMVIHGAIMNQAFTQTLIHKKDLPIEYIIALDKIQKKLPIDDVLLKKLRDKGLVEGHKSNLHISSMVALLTEQKAEYVKNISLNDKFYEELIITHIKKFESASRADIDKLLFSKLSDSLEEKQKKIKINNLLTNMRKRGIIINKGSRTQPIWEII